MLINLVVLLKEEKRYKMKVGYANVRSLNTSFNLVETACNIPPNDSKSMKLLFKVIEKILREPLPIILMGDFNAHNPYWLDKDANKLGNELFDFLVDKDLVVANNSQPTRKDKIIDLTIISNSLQEKISSWKVQKEVYLNTDHSLITFNIGVKLREDPVIRYDFKKTNWVEWE